MRRFFHRLIENPAASYVEGCFTFVDTKIVNGKTALINAAVI